MRPAFLFSDAVGRRYGREIAAVVGIKLALLFVLWLVVIEPWPHSATAAGQSVARMYLGTTLQEHQ